MILSKVLPTNSFTKSTENNSGWFWKSYNVSGNGLSISFKANFCFTIEYSEESVSGNGLSISAKANSGFIIEYSEESVSGNGLNLER